jgi:hypothetical protein
MKSLWMLCCVRDDWVAHTAGDESVSTDWLARQKRRLSPTSAMVLSKELDPKNIRVNSVGR